MRGSAFFLIMVMIAPVLLLAHGGGLDALGCHQDRKAGAYHCHQGELQGQEFTGKEAARSALQGADDAPHSPAHDATDSYDRDLYGGWIDADGDCQDTRQEVLIEESRVPVTLDATGCRVLHGEWYDPYIGQVIIDPGVLDIDHFVPLAEVHRSGGHSWSAARRRAYANDLTNAETLIAVHRSANRSKGGRDPGDWLPRNAEYHCEYVQVWLKVKAIWSLTMDAAEEATIHQVLAGFPILPASLGR